MLLALSVGTFWSWQVLCSCQMGTSFSLVKLSVTRLAPVAITSITLCTKTLACTKSSCINYILPRWETAWETLVTNPWGAIIVTLPIPWQSAACLWIPSAPKKVNRRVKRWRSWRGLTQRARSEFEWTATPVTAMLCLTFTQRQRWTWVSRQRWVWATGKGALAPWKNGATRTSQKCLYSSSSCRSSPPASGLLPMVAMTSGQSVRILGTLILFLYCIILLYKAPFVGHWIMQIEWDNSNWSTKQEEKFLQRDYKECLFPFL